MDVYAMAARNHMERYGTTRRQFAAVAAKNSFHGSLNPLAQFREELTVDEVLADRLIVDPLTRSMCSPIGDGAAAAVVTSPRKAAELGVERPVKVRTMVMHSGWNHTADEPDTVGLCAADAYEEAGLGPDDLDVVELHDASAPRRSSATNSSGCARWATAGSSSNPATPAWAAGCR
ncbi:MAG: thiolase family protein [Microthrixaceae bacterium]|nr:thiolase family protein [Microthrixaceae bacterium]